MEIRLHLHLRLVFQHMSFPFPNQTYFFFHRDFLVIQLGKSKEHENDQQPIIGLLLIEEVMQMRFSFLSRKNT